MLTSVNFIGNVRYDVHINTMFSSSLPPVVCRRVHILLTLFVFVWHSGVQHISCCVFLFCLVFCVPNVASFSGLSSSCVLCTQCCQFLWIVCLRLVFCVPNVASFSGLSSSCVLCTQCCQFLWIVHSVLSNVYLQS
jgi:hypothetical protein